VCVAAMLLSCLLAPPCCLVLVVVVVAAVAAIDVSFSLQLDCVSVCCGWGGVVGVGKGNNTNNTFDRMINFGVVADGVVVFI
jgi:hypothetical protein